MDSQNLCETLRFLFPRNTLKHLARTLNVPIDTARQYLYRGFAPSRRRELALKLLCELERQEAARSAMREKLIDAIMGPRAAGWYLRQAETAVTTAYALKLGDSPQLRRHTKINAKVDLLLYREALRAFGLHLAC